MHVRLADTEVDLLRRLPDELRAAYEAEGGAVHERLFPRAYLDPTEEASERQWQALVHPDLLRERLDALDVMRGTLDRFTGTSGRREATLAEGEPEAWLCVLNDARLALGTRLGVSEETDLEVVVDDERDAIAYGVYGWLTWFQGELVEALLD